jgi:hypothetical protein
MLPIETFLWGFLGSAAVELVTLLAFYQSRRARLPGRYRKVGFWITRFALALLAGVLAVGYEIHQRILAFNIGAATPLIVGLLAKGLRPGPPPAGPLESDTLASVRAPSERSEARATER